MSNKGPYNAYVSAVGHFFPDKVIPNSYYESFLDTTDEWIKTRTGISERRFTEPDQPTSYMAIRAAKIALEKRGMSAEELDLIIVSTVTPDMMYPATAILVAEAIGAKNAFGFDLSAACSGFIFGLSTAIQFIQSGAYKNVLIIGADKMQVLADMSDRNNCILFSKEDCELVIESLEHKGYKLLPIKVCVTSEKKLYRTLGTVLHLIKDDEGEFQCIKIIAKDHSVTYFNYTWGCIMQDTQKTFFDKYQVYQVSDISPKYNQK